MASRLWERAGNARKAYEAVQRWAFTNNPVDGSLHTTYLREQRRLGAAAGDVEGAIMAYRRYLRLRTNVEPALARDAAMVRAELEKLERQGAGRCAHAPSPRQLGHSPRPCCPTPRGRARVASVQPPPGHDGSVRCD